MALVKGTTSTVFLLISNELNAKEGVINKYEAFMTGVRYSKDSLELATCYVNFCHAAAKGLGLRLIRPGLQKAR